MRQQQWFRRDLERSLNSVFGRMRDVADEAEPVTGTDRLGAERGEPVMRYRAGLKVADVVRRVMHELDVPHAALVRLLQPFELHLEKIEPFYIGYDGGLAGGMRGLEVGGSERPT